MLDILVFAFGVMYTPGPVNMLALFAGVNGQGWRAAQFSLGVGTAMFILFLVFSYLGSEIVPAGYRSIIAVLGGIYIGYLGVKIMIASYKPMLSHTKDAMLDFKTGLVLQLCNPKSLVVIIPIVTVQFPRAHIDGAMLAFWSLLLAVMAGGAPCVYLLAGAQLKDAILNPIIMVWVNRVMAVLLWLVAYGFIMGA
ncbi:MAG: LysE family translocator [Paraglaciecola chathamensis]